MNRTEVQPALTKPLLSDPSDNGVALSLIIDAFPTASYLAPTAASLRISTRPCRQADGDVPLLGVKTRDPRVPLNA